MSAVVFLLPMLLSLLYSFYPSVKDRIQWARRFRRYPGLMTPNVFLNSLGGYSTGTFRLRLIQLVRKKGSLVATEEAESVLARLCLSLERDQIQGRLGNTKARVKSVKDSPIHEGEKNAARPGDDFDIWYEKFFRKTRHRGSRWTFEVLDELSLLLEQVRGKRQS